MCHCAQSSQTHLKRKILEKADLKIKSGLTWNLIRQYWPQNKAARPGCYWDDGMALANALSFYLFFFLFFFSTLLIAAADLQLKIFWGEGAQITFLIRTKHLPKGLLQIFELCMILLESSDLLPPVSQASPSCFPAAGSGLSGAWNWP